MHRLTGAFVTDAATASRTLLLDLDRGAWSAEACAAFDIDPATLPRIVGCAEPVGETRAFGVPVPVTGLAVDQQAALFAEGCLAPGQAKCTYGTGAFLLVNCGSTARRSRAGLVTSVAWRLGDVTTYCLDGQVYTVGAALGWLTDLGLLAGPEEIDRHRRRSRRRGRGRLRPGARRSGRTVLAAGRRAAPSSASRSRAGARPWCAP